MLTPVQEFDQLLLQAMAYGASDLFLVADHPPSCRIQGVLRRCEMPPLAASRIADYVASLVPASPLPGIEHAGYVEITHEVSEGGMTRISVSRAHGAYTVAVRILSHMPLPTPDQANLPPEALKLMQLSQGLVVIAGPHGCGKTTTLYTLIEWINQNRAVHICTVEKPSHYHLKPAQAIIQQREVGKDVASDAAGIAAALHQDFDVLMLGEIKDPETFDAALRAASTEHLVIAQGNGVNCGDAVQRILDVGGNAEEIREHFASVLRGVIFQRLVRRADGAGRIPVCEVLVPDRGWIGRRKADGFKLRTRRIPAGCVHMKDELAKLELKQLVDAQDAERVHAEIGA